MLSTPQILAPMFDSLPLLLLFAAMIVGAALYSVEIGRRVHHRRIEERLQESARLYGRVRGILVQRRMA
jgi:hypothetical protein